MLSTRRLLRASKLFCDLKIIEGTNRCRFHVYSVNGGVRQRSEVLRRRQTPLAFGVVNFASSDASVAAGTSAPQVLAELGIISPKTETLETVATQYDSVTETGNIFDSELSSSELSDPEIPPSYDGAVETPSSDSLGMVGVGSPGFEELPPSGVNPSEPSLPEQEDFVSRISTESEEVLAHDSASFEVRASPLDGSFEVVPEVIPTVPNDAASITEQVKDLVSPDVASSVAENVGSFASEPAFSSIGLGGWGPVGLVQYTLEFFHLTLDLPWWGAIALGTLILRTLMFPLVIMAQRNAAKMNNYLPEMQAIQLKMTDARQRGDRLDAARYGQEMMEFMKTKGLNPLKNMAVPLAQAPFFISMFMGIRGMANLPVESFHQGGLWWFTDLTIADQFYLLPLITSATLAITVEVGTDMGKLSSSNMGMAKYLLRAMPVLIFPFTVNFPAGVLVYWCSTNFISLAQVAVLRIPAVRDFFKIERLIKHDKKKLPVQDKGFVGGMKESWTNMKITRELEERERLDNANFLRAGRGAIKKTYKFDPTQPRPPRNLSSIQVKKRD